MAKLMKIDGTIEELEIRQYHLSEIHEMIGGYMGSHNLFNKPYVHIFCNDDGLALGLEPNKAIANYFKEKELVYHQRLVGNIILFESGHDLLVFDGQIDAETGMTII